MINVCAHCGLYRADKTVTGPTSVTTESKHCNQADLDGDTRTAVATCPECGHPHSFLRLPLLLVGGASATGKSAILQQLAGRFTAAVLLEADLLWLQEFEKPSDGHRRFFETWLRLTKNIGQSGRPVALFGAGLAVPENIEQCVERRYFSHTTTWPWSVMKMRCATGFWHDPLGAKVANRNSCKNSSTSIAGCSMRGRSRFHG